MDIIYNLQRKVAETLTYCIVLTSINVEISILLNLDFLQIILCYEAKRLHRLLARSHDQTD